MLEVIRRLQLIEKRRQFVGWVPKKSEPSQERFHPIIVRAVGLRGLEIPVGQWTSEFIQSTPDLSPIHHILLGHIEDEENHDTQLDYLAEYMGVSDVPVEALELTRRWLELPCHPLLKKMVLEAGVFFPVLGMMGVYGKSNILIQSVRQWISSDEAAHVASSRIIIDYLRKKGERIGVPVGLLPLVEDTITYIVGTDGELGRWLTASRNGITSGKIEGGVTMTTVANQDPFTQRKNSEILYQRH